MEVNHSNTAGGSLHISSEVIQKIAKLAALEIDGVTEITMGNAGMKTLLNRISPQTPVLVEVRDEVADITVHLAVQYGAQLTELCEKVQQNVKNSVQNMTQISVAKVNVVVVGLSAEPVLSEDVPLV